MALLLLSAACGGDDDEAASPSETTSTAAVADEPTTTGATQAPATETEAPATTQPEEPAEETGDAVGSAVLTIGDETWTLDSVEFCGMTTSPETVSFALIAKQDDWTLFVEVNDDSGARRLEGDGVYDTINFQNNADPTQSWLANNEAAEVKFIVIDGPSVTANTTFDAVTGLSDDTPGTLEATCP